MLKKKWIGKCPVHHKYFLHLIFSGISNFEIERRRSRIAPQLGIRNLYQVRRTTFNKKQAHRLLGVLEERLIKDINYEI